MSGWNVLYAPIHGIDMVVIMRARKVGRRVNRFVA